MGGQSLAIDLEITLVHNHRASIHERRHRRRQGGAPVFELVYRVVVQVVEELWRNDGETESRVGSSALSRII